MSRKHGPWTIKETALKYRNEFIEVNEDSVLQPDGEQGSYATVRIKPGVSVLPIDEEGFCYLAGQFRYAIGRESIEVVSGAIDEGEDAESAAHRELREELGIEAGELVSLGQLDLDTSIVYCPASLFLARSLRFSRPEQEGTEAIRMKKMSFDEAVGKVMRSEITHGPSCVLILKAGQYLKR